MTKRVMSGAMLAASVAVLVVASSAAALTIIGTDGDDTIVGSPDNDRIKALAGNDRVRARGGDDRSAGGPGEDLQAGGRGDDRIFANRGADTSFGGSGDDDLWGLVRSDVPLEGVDALAGEGGNDTFHARDGEADEIDCGRGRDRARLDNLDVIVDATAEDPNGSCERVGRADPRPEEEEPEVDAEI